MEGEVKEIQMELAAIRKDRLDLHNRKHIDIVSSIFISVYIPNKHFYEFVNINTINHRLATLPISIPKQHWCIMN